MKKVALVTASSSGIGKSIAKQLLRANYIVYINGHTKEKLESILNKIDNKYLKFIHCDISNENEIKQSLEKIFEIEGRIDLIVSNLGSGKSIPGYNVNINEYKRIFEINFFSAVSLSTNAVEYLKLTKGNIVFISSIAGCESINAPIPYSTAKTALISYSKSLSKEIAKYNIRVNCISPGNVIFKGSTWDEKIKKDKDLVKKYINEKVALKKFIKPKDIAKAVIFLENNNSITGTNIIIDAGQINKFI